MKTSVTMDEAGRLVLPKGIRDAIGALGATSLNIEVVGQAARITAARQSHRTLARKRGRLVYVGPLPENWSSGDAILQMRARRVSR